MNIFGKRKLNILVLGADGMLGHDVYERLRKDAACKDSIINVVTGITRDDGYDFTKPDDIDALLKSSIHYDWCINCIAYTDTKKAEHEWQGKIASYKLNVLAPKYIAAGCNYFKTKLIHISTDYVFSENSYDAIDKFLTYSETFPISYYGMHKLLGEKGVAESFNYKEKNYAILRVSWLYGVHKNKSFIHKFMKNVVKALKDSEKSNEDKGPIAVDMTEKCPIVVDMTEKCPIVVDMTANEYSIPTSTKCVIDSIYDVFRDDRYRGILHAVPFCGKVINRFDFAQSILNFYKSTSKTSGDGAKMSDVTLNAVELSGDALQPSVSIMMTSFTSALSWETYLNMFMNKYGQQILEWAIKENEK